MERGEMACDASGKKDYYGMLGVSTKASQEEIKDRFKRIAFQYHPDKNPDKDTTREFAEFAEAYDVLSDPVSRALYDIVVGVREDTEEEVRRINNLRKDEAKKAVSNMQATVDMIRQQELERNGLIILEAMYGDLASKTRKINVTVPVQCLVDASALIIPGGPSKAWLDGFYDPTDGSNVGNELFVRYKFLGKLHQCQASDTEELCIPMQDHLVEDDEELNMSYQERRAAKKEEQSKKKRRRFLLFSSVVLFLGWWLVKDTETYKNIRTSIGNVTAPMLLRIFGPPVPTTSPSS